LYCSRVLLMFQSISGNDKDCWQAAQVTIAGYCPDPVTSCMVGSQATPETAT
jgi:hypothetical protein